MISARIKGSWDLLSGVSTLSEPMHAILQCVHPCMHLFLYKKHKFELVISEDEMEIALFIYIMRISTTA